MARQPRSHSRWIVGVPAAVLALLVTLVAGFWVWSRFPLSGDTVYADAQLTFSYDRTTTQVEASQVAVVNILDPEQLAAASASCPIPHDADYYRQLVERFPAGSMATLYTMRDVSGFGGWTLTVLPNALHYSDMPELKYDLDNCGGGEIGLPSAVSKLSFALATDCQMISSERSATFCRTGEVKVLDSLKLH